MGVLQEPGRSCVLLRYEIRVGGPEYQLPSWRWRRVAVVGVNERRAEEVRRGDDHKERRRTGCRKSESSIVPWKAGNAARADPLEGREDRVEGFVAGRHGGCTGIRQTCTRDSNG